MNAMLTAVQDLFADLLPAHAEARALVSWLLGTVVQQNARPRDPVDLDCTLPMFEPYD